MARRFSRRSSRWIAFGTEEGLLRIFERSGATTWDEKIYWCGKWRDGKQVAM